jgi:hypothetical protein
MTKEEWGLVGVGAVGGWDVCLDQTLDNEKSELEITFAHEQFRFKLKDPKTDVKDLIATLKQVLDDLDESENRNYPGER